jgi:ATP-binding cassette, subfamily B (MDR/TAP), member 1
MSSRYSDHPRLSTIKNADQIVVMAQGKIIEQGTHNQLLEMNGVYKTLAEKQQMTSGPDESIEEAMRNIDRNETSDIDEKTDSLNRHETGSGEKSASKQEHYHDSTQPSEKSYSFWQIVAFVASFNKQEWYLMLAGFLFSVGAGAGNPVQSVFFAKSISSMSLSEDDFDEIQAKVNFWSSMYLMLGFVALISWFGQGACFALCSERLVYRARDRAFRAILNQDMAFFNQPGSSTGALTASLSSGATALAGVSGVTLGTIFVVSTTLVGGIILSLVVVSLFFSSSRSR